MGASTIFRAPSAHRATNQRSCCKQAWRCRRSACLPKDVRRSSSAAASQQQDTRREPPDAEASELNYGEQARLTHRKCEQAGESADQPHNRELVRQHAASPSQPKVLPELLPYRIAEPREVVSATLFALCRRTTPRASAWPAPPPAPDAAARPKSPLLPLRAQRENRRGLRAGTRPCRASRRSATG